MKTMGRFVNRTGTRYTKLTAIGAMGRSSVGSVIWECKCDCGNVVNVIGSSLTSGNTKACGKCS